MEHGAFGNATTDISAVRSVVEPVWFSPGKTVGGPGKAFVVYEGSLTMSRAAVTLECPSSIKHLASIEADLNYLSPLSGRPRTYTYDPPPGVPRTTFLNEPRRVQIRDIRPTAGGFSLDQQGFAVVDLPTAVDDFYNEDSVKNVYYPESEALLKEITGADRVLIFDHTVRRRVQDTVDQVPVHRQPALRVHVDYTENSGAQRVRDLLPDEATDLLAGRVQIINLWRPVRGPVLDTPLAIADARSVEPTDLVPSDLVHRDRVGESYAVTFNPEHAWFYLSGMQRNEAFLFKCYDSDVKSCSRFTPHSAFIDPTAPSEALPRESIELRMLAFHYA
jgi:hypothetical protein